MIKTVVHVTSKKVCYFDASDRFHVLEVSNMEKFRNKRNLSEIIANTTSVNTSCKGNRYTQIHFGLSVTGIERMKAYIYSKTKIENIKIYRVSMVSNVLNENASIKDFERLYFKLKSEKVEKVIYDVEFSSMLISISMPDFLRKKGNIDINTFDYVRFNMLLRSSTSREDKIIFAKDYTSDILFRLSDKTKQSYNFKIHGGTDADTFGIGKMSLMPDGSLDVILVKK